MAEALWASGPHPEYERELALYGRFVGAWDFDWTGFDEEGNVAQTAPGEWLFDWGLEGRAVVDVWICPNRTERVKEGAPKGEWGVTVRFYDPEIDAWRVTWHGPGFGNVRPFIAKEEGDEIVQRGTTADGEPMRWVFSDVTAHTFEWRSEISKDGSETWRKREHMSVRRRA
jgi:hypothetical protein